MTDKDYKGLYRRIGHEFRDRHLLRLALSHRSSGRDHNERLEFLGDAILGFIISEHLYMTMPEAREGDLSRLRASLVQKSTLADLARELGLGDHLILGTGELKSGGKRRESILADTVEAIISAVYQDAGLEVCREVVLGWYRERLSALQHHESNKDAKTRLQEYLQARKQPLPEYDVDDIAGQDHAQIFRVTCRVASPSLVTRGEAGSRREAEQQAAGQALIRLGVESDDV